RLAHERTAEPELRRRREIGLAEQLADVALYPAGANDPVADVQDVEPLQHGMERAAADGLPVEGDTTECGPGKTSELARTEDVDVVLVAVTAAHALERQVDEPV